MVWTLGSDDVRGLGSFSGAWDGEVLIEAPPSERAWWLTTEAYNTLLVDGQGQDPSRTFDLMETRSSVGAFQVRGQVGMAQAYPQPDLTLSRYFAENTNTHELVIVDVLRGSSNHVLTSHLHSSGEIAEMDGTLLVTGSRGCLRVSSASSVPVATGIAPDPVAVLPPDDAELKDYRLAFDAARRRATGAGSGLKWFVAQAEALERPAGVVMVDRDGALGTAVQHWSQKGQALTGKVQVPRTGFYRMLVKYASAEPVSLMIEWDGRPLFRGMKPVALPVSGTAAGGTNGWSFLNVGEHNEPDGYAVYLEEGEHTLALTHGGGGQVVLDYVLFYPGALTRDAALAACNDTAALTQRGDRLRVSRTYEAAPAVVAITVFVPSPTWRGTVSKWKRPSFVTPDAAPPELRAPDAATVTVADEVGAVELPLSRVKLRIEADGMRVRFKQVTTEKGGKVRMSPASAAETGRSP
jgi:hypothetical protein